MNHLRDRSTRFLGLVNKVASFTIGAETGRMVAPAKFGFVLGMARNLSDFAPSVRELAFISVFADSGLAESAA